MTNQIRIARNDEEARMIAANMAGKGLHLTERHDAVLLDGRRRMTFLPRADLKAAAQEMPR